MPNTNVGLGRAILAVGTGNLAASVLTAVGGVLVASLVTPSVLGEFRQYSLPLLYMTFLHLGTVDGLVRQIPILSSQNAHQQLTATVASAEAWNLIVSVAAACVFLTLALWNVSHSAVNSAIGWLAQAISAVATFYVAYLTATYRSLANFTVLARIQISQSIFSFVLIVPIVYLNIIGLHLRLALPLLLGAYLFYKFRPYPVRAKFSVPHFNQLVKIGAPLYCWNTLNTSLWLAAEYTAILYFADVAALGLFTLAIVVREGFCMLPQSVYQVLLPRTIGRLAEGKIDAISYSIKVAFFTTAAVGAVAIPLWVTVDYAVRALLPQYVNAIGPIKICLWFAVVQAASIPVSLLYSSSGSWPYGRPIGIGFLCFILLMIMQEGEAVSLEMVLLASLAGRVARVLISYVEIARVRARMRKVLF